MNWKGNLGASRIRGSISGEFKTGELYEKHTGATWKLGPISAFG
jgi:hypothetical protein